jgi:hypothetical protein
VTEREREVIVTNNGSGGSSAGALVAGIVAVVLVLLAIWYFGIRGTDDADVNIDVDVPETIAPDE